MALMVVRSCAGIDGGLPQMLRARMMFNVALDFGLGLVPVLGDLADAVFRANTRNAWLLEVYLTKKAEAQRTGRVSDPELGNLQVPTRPPAARVGGGRNRQSDEEMAMGDLDSSGQALPAPSTGQPSTGKLQQSRRH